MEFDYTWLEEYGQELEEAWNELEELEVAK